MTGFDTNERMKANVLENSDPGRVLNLVMSLTNDCCNLLQTKVNAYLADECEAELVFHMVLHTERSEGYIDAVGKYPLCRKKKIFMMPEIMNKLASAKHMDLFYNLDPEIINIAKPYLPNATVKTRVVFHAVSGSQFTVLVCVVAPIIQQDYVHSIIKECYAFVFPIILKSIKLEYEISLKENCQTLLKVVRKLFVKVSSHSTLLKISIKQARKITKAEHCVLFLIDVENMELVQKYQDEDPESDLIEQRHPMGIGLVGETINTGFLINARNAKEHPSYDPQIDTLPGIDCRSMLLFPIRDQSGIVGVCQLINKVDDPYFDILDEEIALAFSVYCGICVVHSLVYHKVEEGHIRNALANELILYHMQVSDAEVSKLLNCAGFHSYPDFTKLDFNHRALPARELPCYVMKMFEDLGFLKKFNIKRQKLARFVLQVRKGYRDVPQRNFLHGFNACQWVYALMMNCRLVENCYLTDLQAMMCIIACLMHCLDHRGSSGTLQINGKISLAAIFASDGSVLERYHLAQALCILNLQGCDILDGLPRQDYDRALLMLKEYIFSTDLVLYFKNFNDYQIIAADFQKCNRAHIVALQAMLMVATNRADSLKDWSALKRSFAAMIAEFFGLGDMEKIRGELPEWATDQEKYSIPDLAIQYLTEVCMPIFQILRLMIPELADCEPVINDHVLRWEAARSIFAEVPPTGALAILLSPELDELIDYNIEQMLNQEPETSQEQLRTSGTQSSLRSKAMLTSAQRLQSQQSRKSKITIEGSKKPLQGSETQIEGSKPQMSESKSKPQVRMSEAQVEGEGPAKAKPSQAQVQASQPQVQGSQPQVQASQPQVQGSQPQVQGSQPQVEASQAQVQPSQPQVQASQPQVEASKAQAQASQPQVQASQPQVQASQPQVQASQPQVQASQPQVQASQPQVQKSVTEQPAAEAPPTEVQASQPKIEASKPQVQEEAPAQLEEAVSQPPVAGPGSQPEVAGTEPSQAEVGTSATADSGSQPQVPEPQE